MASSWRGPVLRATYSTQQTRCSSVLDEGMEEPINEGMGQESKSRTQANRHESSLRVRNENVNSPSGQGGSVTWQGKGQGHQGDTYHLFPTHGYQRYLSDFLVFKALTNSSFPSLGIHMDQWAKAADYCQSGIKFQTFEGINSLMSLQEGTWASRITTLACPTRTTLTYAPKCLCPTPNLTLQTQSGDTHLPVVS